MQPSSDCLDVLAASDCVWRHACVLSLNDGDSSQGFRNSEGMHAFFLSVSCVMHRTRSRL